MIRKVRGNQEEGTIIQNKKTKLSKDRMVPVGLGNQEIIGTHARAVMRVKFKEHSFSLKKPGCEGEEKGGGN